MADDSDYCPKCEDVMKPMSEAKRKLVTFAMLGKGVSSQSDAGKA